MIVKGRDHPGWCREDDAVLLFHKSADVFARSRLKSTGEVSQKASRRDLTRRTVIAGAAATLLAARGDVVAAWAQSSPDDQNPMEQDP
jgi:hypothetical protein